MLLINSAAVSGVWFTYDETVDEDGKRTPEQDPKFLIRRLTLVEKSRIQKKRNQKHPTSQYNAEGGAIVPNDPDLTRECDVLASSLAILDAKNAEIPGDCIGEKGEEVVKLDGRMGDTEFKCRVLTELWLGNPRCLPKWAIEKSLSLDRLAAEEKAELAKT